MTNSSAQQGSNPQPQGQQQGASAPAPQQAGGAQTPAKPAVIRDWAAF